MQTCGADPRGVRVEWRNGGGRTLLVGVTELSRMMGTDPNLALTVMEGLGRWEAGRSAGGMKEQRKGWGRLQDRAEETSSSSSGSSSTTSGGKTPPPPQGPQTPPPPKAPKKSPRHLESSDKEAPPPPPRAPEQAQGQGQAPGQGQGQSQPPPPQTPSPTHPCKKGAGTPMGMCRVWGTPGMSLGRRGAMGGPSAK